MKYSLTREKNKVNYYEISEDEVLNNGNYCANDELAVTSVYN